MEGASQALTTEQEEAMQFSVLQSQPTGEEQTEVAATQIGSEAAISQTETATELKSGDMTASAFEIIPSMPEPEPAQGENDGVQKSMEG